ncbi:MAG: DUF551 domain-containing protein [Cryomorphaceae bacterium]|nr:MAG: DUF551 domain-containing protein [Cryomorphaceae bacterium]
MGSEWISVKEALPSDGERVLVFIPNNEVYLPGKTGDKLRIRVIVMKFQKDFLSEEKALQKNTARHFWVGEGQSNHYFEDITHWRPIPDPPAGFDE